ncbi:MAG: exopolysaccharide biosynthesis polyprenyl glycosylphosphotransferase [Planctomycetes bacterium]|nr:exopolysaccharide biosynthesis polyprenyl glycosylphosphotransferase [Planctomycetota bacterium]
MADEALGTAPWDWIDPQALLLRMDHSQSEVERIGSVSSGYRANPENGAPLVEMRRRIAGEGISPARFDRKLRRAMALLSRLAESPLPRAVLLPAVAVLSYELAFQARTTFDLWGTRHRMPGEGGHIALYWFILVGAGQLIGAAGCALFHPFRQVTFRLLFTRVGLTAILSPLPLLGIQYLTDRAEFPRSVAFVYVGLDFAFLLALSLAVQRLERIRRERILLLGPWRETEHFLQALRTLPSRSRPLFSPAQSNVQSCTDESLEDVCRVLRETRPDRVYLVRSSYEEDHVLRLLEATPATISFYIVPSTWDSIISRLALGPILGDLRLFEIRSPLSDPAVAFAKRAFDVVAALLLLLLTAPIAAVAAAAIRLTSPGPVFYIQDRIGRGGRGFRMIKFRTMKADAESETGLVLARRNDPRITPVGRWLRALGLDELPQLWNVVKGEMSLVGPRPERPALVDSFRAQLPGYELRHLVRPGITGMAQIYGRYHSHPREKLRFDLAYIFNYTPALDIVILLKTVWVTLTRAPGEERDAASMDSE